MDSRPSLPTSPATSRIDLPLGPLPSREEWEARAKQDGVPGAHARRFLAMLDAGEEIPTTIPDYPVQTWCFGDDLAMVFLGGEVVVDYAIRMNDMFDGDRLWINAYSNDVPCYIASKRILREGGYEADSSMLYYARPTRLSPDAEDLICDTVQKLLPHDFYSEELQTDFPAPKSPEDALATMTTGPGLKVELVASEPLIHDPVAYDWDVNGRLWVVEMGDYPNGAEDGGGRIRVLTDTDGDGRYDEATTFLDNLPFPTGICHWRNGVIITAAPDVFYAEDTDGDGRADLRETLYTGFGEGNQQHRVNGLRWGSTAGCISATATAAARSEAQERGSRIQDREKPMRRTQRLLDLRSRILNPRPFLYAAVTFACSRTLVRSTPSAARLSTVANETTSATGSATTIPTRSGIMYSTIATCGGIHATVSTTHAQISEVPGAAPVYPASRTLARFNDFYAANRFTSACSTMIYRDRLLGDQFYGNSFTCEPVHNLVSRQVLERDGATFRAHRADDERGSEFLASSDNWFRPTMVRTGPDGAIYVSDMYRFVIEHPTRIPAEYQRKLNLRAGEDRPIRLGSDLGSASDRSRVSPRRGDRTHEAGSLLNRGTKFQPRIWSLAWAVRTAGGETPLTEFCCTAVTLLRWMDSVTWQCLTFRCGSSSGAACLYANCTDSGSESRCLQSCRAITFRCRRRSAAPRRAVAGSPAQRRRR
ncbi:MAG: hypothetical protein R3C19_19680 [Planctomycetaceae bacterium]